MESFIFKEQGVDFFHDAFLYTMSVTQSVRAFHASDICNWIFIQIVTWAG